MVPILETVIFFAFLSLLIEVLHTVKTVSAVAGILSVALLGSFMKTPPEMPKKIESTEPVFNTDLPEGDQLSLLTVSTS
ncbi:hypothetical protein D3C75_959400 [compost metagenome]